MLLPINFEHYVHKILVHIITNRTYSYSSCRYMYYRFFFTLCTDCCSNNNNKYNINAIGSTRICSKRMFLFFIQSFSHQTILCYKSDRAYSTVRLFRSAQNWIYEFPSYVSYGQLHIRINIKNISKKKRNRNRLE